MPSSPSSPFSSSKWRFSSNNNNNNNNNNSPPTYGNSNQNNIAGFASPDLGPSISTLNFGNSFARSPSAGSNVSGSFPFLSNNNNSNNNKNKNKNDNSFSFPHASGPSRSRASRPPSVIVGRTPADFASKTSLSQNTPSPPHRKVHRNNRVSMMSITSSINDCGTTLDKTTPPELVPSLKLLNIYKNRVFIEGYFLKLSDLDANGNPASNRQWEEVYGKLTGSVLAMWNADELDRYTESSNQSPTAINSALPPSIKPTYINITDSAFRTMISLPTSSGTLTNLIALSTTLRNRYLLQFSTQEDLFSWTAAFHLSVFEHVSLQEAYTGALLSAKGIHINGIRNLLTENRNPLGEWVRVRFGAGMPWKRCYAVIHPSAKSPPPPSSNSSKKPKKQAELEKLYKGDISLYESKNKTKKPPLAKIINSHSLYAVYPESQVLIDQSTLFKVEGQIEFENDASNSNNSSKKSKKNKNSNARDAFVFLMPDLHPAVPGYETLIRTIIPCFDTFGLYGRPHRLNSDKNDTGSLLFAFPTSQRPYYLAVDDLIPLVSSTESENWSPAMWRNNIKTLMSRKIADGLINTTPLSPLPRPNEIAKKSSANISSSPLQNKSSTSLAGNNGIPNSSSSKSLSSQLTPKDSKKSSLDEKENSSKKSLKTKLRSIPKKSQRTESQESNEVESFESTAESLHSVYSNINSSSPYVIAAQAAAIGPNSQIQQRADFRNRTFEASREAPPIPKKELYSKPSNNELYSKEFQSGLNKNMPIHSSRALPPTPGDQTRLAIARPFPTPPNSSSYNDSEGGETFINGKSAYYSENASGINKLARAKLRDELFSNSREGGSASASALASSSRSHARNVFASALGFKAGSVNLSAAVPNSGSELGSKNGLVRSASKRIRNIGNQFKSMVLE